LAKQEKLIILPNATYQRAAKLIAWIQGLNKNLVAEINDFFFAPTCLIRIYFPNL
jgi:hypothetical protein